MLAVVDETLELFHYQGLMWFNKNGCFRVVLSQKFQCLGEIFFNVSDSAVMLHGMPIKQFQNFWVLSLSKFRL